MAQERKEKNEKIKEITEQLHEGIKDLFESEKYKNYLRVMSRFTNYSFNNTVLIALQRPDASAVAGYRAWETKFDRHVKPGSKGICIIEPTPWKKKGYEVVKDEDGNPKLDADGNEIKKEVQYVVQNFKLGYVFAYEDTDGKPLPSIVTKLQGDVSDYDTFLKILQEVSPVPVVFEEIDNGAYGYYRLDTKDIHIDSRLPQLQTLKTLTHEIAHSICHAADTGEDKEANRFEREVTAESVAFTVLSYYNFTVSDYSFGYIAGWSSGKQLKELQQKMDIIRKTANGLISAIDEKLMIHEMNQARELAFKSGIGYLHIWKEDEHYHYQFANPQFEVVSAGQLDNGALPMTEAAAKVMDFYGTTEKAWTPYEPAEFTTKVQERLEAVIVEKENALSEAVQGPQRTVSYKR